MANDLPFNIVMVGTFPNGYKGGPQKYGEDLAVRLKLQSTQAFALFATEATEPSSNVGPWFKNGIQVMVWDDELGRYRQQTIDFTLLEDGQIPQAKVLIDPALFADGSIPQSKIVIDPSALPDGSIPQSKLQPGFIVNPRPFRATTQGGSQTFVVNNVENDVGFPTESFDPDNVYNPVTSRFTGGDAGFYFVSFFCQFDNVTAQSSTMQVGVFVADGATNANLLIGATSAVASPPGDRWFVTASGLVQLNQGQTVKIRALATDGIGTGTIRVSENCHWSVYQVKKLVL